MRGTVGVEAEPDREPRTADCESQVASGFWDHLRGFLGNALGTQLCFTTNLTEWKEIFRQRISDAADWEMREAIIEAKNVIANRWPDRFPKPVAP